MRTKRNRKLRKQTKKIKRIRKKHSKIGGNELVTETSNMITTCNAKLG
jgi:hypothetical protein